MMISIAKNVPIRFKNGKIHIVNFHKAILTSQTIIKS